MNIQDVFVEMVMPSLKYRVYIIHYHYYPHIDIETAHHSFFLVLQNYINNVSNSFMKQLFTEHLLGSRLWNNFHQR